MKKLLLILFIIPIVFFAIKINPKPAKVTSDGFADKGKPLAAYENMHAEILITVRQRISVSLHGTICVEGDKFRLVASSVLGKEIDVGINDSELWYWSRRGKPYGLYFSSLDNIGKTKLKPALDPKWMLTCVRPKVESTGENIKMGENQMFLKEEKNHLGEKATIGTLVGESGAIKGSYLYGSDGSMTASSEISEWDFLGKTLIPRKIHIIWYKEGIAMDWTIRNANVNTGIRKEAWTMPQIRPRFDIGN